MQKYQMVVLTNAVAGREVEFKHWYDDVHLDQVAAIDGFTSAKRFPLTKMVSEGVKYSSLAVYEIETDDLDAVLAEMNRLSGTEQLIVSEALDTDDLYASIYAVE